MKRVFAILLLLVIAAGAAMTHQADTPSAKDKKQKATASKVFRWHGIIQRHNADKSTLDVARHGFVRTVVYSDSTQWLSGGKPADPKEFSDGTDVIVFGNLDKNGRVEASRINLNSK
jgi:Domain of unknown function (DUF5666)